jgi:hypothetical protein
MSPIVLILIVSTLLVLTPLFRVLLLPRIRRTSPRKRYTVFAVLLGCGVSSQIVGAAIAFATRHPGLGVLFITTALLLGASCALEMQKLGRERQALNDDPPSPYCCSGRAGDRL